jgi:hypothetical protein
MSTNEPLPRIDMNYFTLRMECEKLLKIAEQLEGLANSNTAFATDPQFDEIKKLFREQYQSMVRFVGSVT